jgi:hypothetical protein
MCRCPWFRDIGYDRTPARSTTVTVSNKLSAADELGTPFSNQLSFVAEIFFGVHVPPVVPLD